VDGNNHQIQRIKSEAKARGVKVTIVVDLSDPRRHPNCRHAIPLFAGSSA